MEEFDFTRRVSATQAKHDKISIKVKSWYIHTTNIQGFKNLLAIPASEDRNSNRPTASLPVHGWLFNRPSENPKMEIRRAALDPFYLTGKPLISGSIFIANAYASQTESLSHEYEDHAVHLPVPTRHHISSRALHLNPTRYMRHFYHRTASENAWFACRNLLSANDVSVPANDSEFALDSETSDNWLPVSHLLRLTPELVQQHLSDYIGNAFQAITSEIDRAKRLLRLTTQQVVIFHNAPRYTLDRVETYWEFHSSDATTRVRQIGELLGSLAGRSNNTIYQGNPSSDLRENSICLRYQLRTGVMLRIYAKTPTRIRFEVEHNFQKCTIAIQRTVNTHVAVVETLANVRDLAAQELNRVFERLEMVGRVPHYSHPAIHFLLLFARSLPGEGEEEKDSEKILSLLAANKHVSASRSHPLYASLNKLKEAGLLMKIGNIFHPNPSSRRAIDLLSSEKLETLRFYHRRRTSVFVRRVRPQPQQTDEST